MQSKADPHFMNQTTEKDRTENGCRTEMDSLGQVRVPRGAYYGAQTQRAVENFQISGLRMAPSLIHAFGLVKYACATVNRKLGLFASGHRPLSDGCIKAIQQASREVEDGKHDDQFPLDVFQTGSGTSTNINVNEVIANRAIEISGGDRFSSMKSIHPLDHVNMGQSTNDVFPTVTHVAVARTINERLIPSLENLARALVDKSQSWDSIIKVGRTHLMDATPIRLGQEISGFAHQAKLSRDRARQAVDELLQLPIGGTAVGTGINTHRLFGEQVSQVVADETRLRFVEAANHFEAGAARDGLVAAHGHLRSVGVSLFHIANNVRWLASGPRCGFS